MTPNVKRVLVAIAIVGVIALVNEGANQETEKQAQFCSNLYESLQQTGVDRTQHALENEFVGELDTLDELIAGC